MSLGTAMRPEIAGMSDANGWSLPQHYLTIQGIVNLGRQKSFWSRRDPLS
jgi:hypothetical protein